VEIRLEELGDKKPAFKLKIAREYYDKVEKNLK
jgi:hypothetical protein